MPRKASTPACWTPGVEPIPSVIPIMILSICCCLPCSCLFRLLSNVLVIRVAIFFARSFFRGGSTARTSSRDTTRIAASVRRGRQHPVDALSPAPPASPASPEEDGRAGGRDCARRRRGGRGIAGRGGGGEGAAVARALRQGQTPSSGRALPPCLHFRLEIERLGAPAT